MRILWVVVVVLSFTPAFAQHDPDNKLFKDPNVKFDKLNRGLCNFSMMDTYFDDIKVPWKQLPANWETASCWWGSKTNMFFLPNGDVYYLHGPSLIEQSCAELDETFIREFGKYKGNLHKGSLQHKTHHFIMLDYAPYTVNICLPEDNDETFVIFFVGHYAQIQAPYGKGIIFNGGSPLSLPFEFDLSSWSLFESVPNQVTVDKLSWQRSEMRYQD